MGLGVRVLGSYPIKVILFQSIINILVLKKMKDWFPESIHHYEL